ncbi:TonB-dependent receptor [Pedobacter agri]|uniref:TonB-dependent receptor n=1 Tax=Pedobacter agri TaxID=454586 RepID=UPI00292FD723|nr:TonB-dependent receptor [Pedobacter agri]
MKKNLLKTIMRIAVVNITLCLTLMGSAFATVSKGQVLEQKLNLNEKDKAVSEVLDAISRQAKIHFVYSPSLIKSTNKVSLVSRNEKLSSILAKLFTANRITYELAGSSIVLNRLNSEEAARESFPALLVKGRVTDKAGLPITGVSITIKGSTVAVATDRNGNFSITVPNENSVLVFSYVGYLTQEVLINSGKDLNITLQEDAKQLDQVVVVAYGNTTQRTTTGSLQTVSGKELQDLPVAQFTQKLQGKMAGVQINQGTGKPGQPLTVRIRNSASISTGSSPLYVVDGFPIVGDITNINPDEIEDITVLKDAASTALYGSRAAFGVVIITTKTAKAGQTNISVNAYTGIQRVPQQGRPDMMNGTEWAQFKKESFEDRGVAVPAAFQNPAQYGEGYDWYDAMFRNGMISDMNVSLNTSKEKFSSAVTASYLRQQGVLLNSDYNRISLRANNLFKVSDNFRIGLNIAPTYTFDNSPNSDGMFFGGNGLINNAMLTPPILAFKNPDGSLPISVTTPGVTAFPTPNWVRAIQEIKSRSNNNRLLSSFYAEYQPIKGLLLKSSIGIDMGQSTYNYFQPSTASRGFNSEANALNANLNQTNSNYYSWLAENTATYTRQIGEHSFDLLGGYTAQFNRSNATSISGSNFPDDRVRTINAALVKNNASQDIQEWSLVSYLARLNYNYKGRYLLGASVRRDGSNRFATNKKYGNFPAVSAGWIVSEESFMKGLKWLSFLKLRGSYGLVGNNNIGNYSQYANIGSANTIFGSTISSGVSLNSLSNNELGWERTKQVDVAVDLGFLENRINFTYEYYKKRTDNLLYTVAIPRESGFGSYTSNLGSVDFWGHEFLISTKNLIGAFKWNTTFNISFADNKVKALSSISDRLYAGTGNAVTITQVGKRLGEFWGLIQDGVYQNQADFNNSPKNINSQVGTIKYRDLNGDGVIKYGLDEGDKTVIGNPYPKFIYGFTNTFSYKNFDLTIVGAGSQGNAIARMSDEGTANLDGVFNVLRDVKGRWRSESNPGEGKYGKTSGSTSDERSQFSTRFIQDGSYLAIKNITLGYLIPTEKLKAIKSIRLYTSVQQAFVFTGYDGINPEIGTNFDGNPPGSLQQGLDFAAYPVPRTFTFGLNVNFK